MKSKDGSAVVARIGQGSTRWILAISLCWGALSCSKDDPDGDEPIETSGSESESQSQDDAAFAADDGSAQDSSTETIGSLTEDRQTEPKSEDSIEKTLASLSTSDSSGEAQPSSSPESSDTADATNSGPRGIRVKNTALGPKTSNVLGSAPAATYVVAGGDSLTKIAKKIFGHTKHWEDIAALNELTPPYRIYPGQGLRFPLLTPEAKSFAEAYRKNQKSITVQKGDSLSKLAAKVFGSPDSWRRLFNYNKDKILDPNILPAGITLAYFDGTGESSAEVKPAAQTPVEPSPAPAAAAPETAAPAVTPAPAPPVKQALRAKVAPPTKMPKKATRQPTPNKSRQTKTEGPNIKISPNDLDSP